MALLFRGQLCSLCRMPMLENQEVFATWGVWLPPSDPLVRFCDASLHWTCYADWPERSRFAESYFAFWKEKEKSDPYWHRAFSDEEVSVNVGLAGAMICLRATGSRIPVQLEDWENWLGTREPDTAHPVVKDVLSDAKRRLNESVPTASALLAGIDWVAKNTVIEEYRVKLAENQRGQENTKRQRREETRRYNDACASASSHQGVRIIDDG